MTTDAMVTRAWQDFRDAEERAEHVATSRGRFSPEHIEVSREADRRYRRAAELTARCSQGAPA